MNSVRIEIPERIPQTCTESRFAILFYFLLSSFRVNNLTCAAGATTNCVGHVLELRGNPCQSACRRPPVARSSGLNVVSEGREEVLHSNFNVVNMNSDKTGEESSSSKDDTGKLSRSIASAG